MRKRKHSKAGKLGSKPKHAPNFVRNISSTVLSNAELAILNKGLKFVPSCKGPSTEDLKLSLTNMTRRMKCKVEFESNKDSPGIKHPLKAPSGFDPQISVGAIMEYFHLTNESLSKVSNPAPPNRDWPDNLSKSERKAITKLKAKKDILIVPADKNSSAVVMDKSDYILEADRQLADIHYERVNNQDFSPLTLVSLVNRLALELRTKELIDKPTFDFLTVIERCPKFGELYLLPKIHKLSKEEMALVERVSLSKSGLKVKGRPIISACGTAINRVSKLLDLFLVPLAKLLDTYVQDTPDFIRQIESLPPLDANVLLVSYDCTSLYTNLTFNEILTGLAEKLPDESYAPGIPFAASKELLLRLTKVVLENNFFRFNGTLYRQTVGVSMGSSSSPECADLRLHGFLNDIISSSGIDRTKVLHHMRFRDDGFMLWHNTHESEIKAFFDYANTQHELLKFTYTISRSSTVFLDTEVFKGKRFESEKILDIKSYSKETDLFQYLDRTSHHPEHTFPAFLLGKLNTLLRNNSDPTIFEEKVDLFKKRALNRGYDSTLFDSCLAKIRTRNRATCLRKKSDRMASSAPLAPKRKLLGPIVVTKLPQNPLGTRNLKRLFSKHWDIIDRVPHLRTLFPSRPMLAFRKHNNLRSILKMDKIRVPRSGRTPYQPSFPLVPVETTAPAGFLNFGL